MGRKKREIPPWSSAEMALAECKRLLGDEFCATVLKGLRRKVRRPRRLRETVALWKSLRALGPGLRNLKKTIEDAWAVEREGTAPIPETILEDLKESAEELKVAPVGPYAVRKLVERLKRWLSEGDDLLNEADRIRPRGEIAETDEAETTAIARYLVTVSSEEGRSISKHIAALLEVAHGLELPQATDARDAAWEKRLDKWKKALDRARASMSRRQVPAGRRQGGRKLRGDNPPAKPTAVPR